jgi:hypothetical protein
MKFFSFLVVFFLTFITCRGQNLIGYNSRDIRTYMRANRSDMNMDNVNNKSFRYLKYSDKYDAQTILFFLTTDSVCRNIRIVCNNSIRSAKMNELDTVYSKIGEKSWIDRRSGKNYVLELVDGEWSFSIAIEPEK